MREQHGTAVILVEHDLDMVAQVVDRVIVLDFGQEIAAVRAAARRRHGWIMDTYLLRRPGQAGT